MDDYNDWQFSTEVQADLAKFLEAVKTRTNGNSNKIQKILQIMPQEFQCEAIHYEVLNSFTLNNESDVIVIDDDDSNDGKQQSSQIPNVTQKEKNESDVIVIDDDDSNDGKQQSSQIPNVTQKLTAHESEVNVIDSGLRDFIEYVQETIENQGSSLKTDDINKLASHYTDSDLSIIFTKLNTNISNRGINNLGQSIISNNHSNIYNIVKQFCRHILLVKLQTTELTETLQILIKEFINTYSSITRTEVFVPLLQTNSNHRKVYESLINLLTQSERDYVLRDFIFSCSELEIFHLSTLQSLVNAQTDDAVKHRLINLMEGSADKFNNEKLFLKLLLVLIQCLGKGFENQEQALCDIIEKNTTLLKNSARKTLQEWRINFID